MWATGLAAGPVLQWLWLATSGADLSNIWKSADFTCEER